MDKENIVYGLRAVLEAIEAGKSIERVFIQQGLKGDLSKELENSLRKHNIRASYVPQERLYRLTKENHQGVVAQISPVAFQDFEELVNKILQKTDKPLFLLLDRVSDVRNLGAIIRTASCTGVDAIILPSQETAPISADTVKTSAGAAYSVPLCKVTHLKDAIYYLQASGVHVVAATEKASDPIYDLDLKQRPVALVMGSEGKGIHPGILKLCDQQAKLPILGPIQSLNVSVACGVFLYEILRQRTY
ncbi:23S rRNA (guanosine(2251)-2'-O)-methyltransferase RlmB [Robiginitalea sp. IMCC43444]|uniref:23S rRNA (guanosine(2251)-2'-O)-methyltransferase RlmB n=1 Tax=Robiginitalea sp. IMCC43444 TaxID=3459121 RepID=UPI004043576D